MADHAQPGNVSSAIDHHVGFHFSLTSTLSARPPSGCDQLCLDYTLPHGLFADPYELDLRSDTYSYAMDTVPDLERPVSAVPTGDTLLRLHVNPSLTHSDAVEISLPLHARYGYLSNGDREEAYARLFLPSPHAFWRCPGRGRLHRHQCLAPLRRLRSFKTDRRYR